jgi:hypothetical protein
MIFDFLKEITCKNLKKKKKKGTENTSLNSLCDIEEETLGIDMLTWNELRFEGVRLIQG